MATGAPALRMRVAVETGADTLFVAGPWKLKYGLNFFFQGLLFVTSVIHYQCDILMTGILKKVEHIFFPNFVFSIGFQVSLLKKNIT